MVTDFLLQLAAGIIITLIIKPVKDYILGLESTSKAEAKLQELRRLQEAADDLWYQVLILVIMMFAIFVLSYFVPHQRPPTTSTEFVHPELCRRCRAIERYNLIQLRSETT